MPKVIYINKGFSLVEILVSISILAILSLIGFNVYYGATQSGKDGKRIADVKAIGQAYETAYSEITGYQSISSSNFTAGTTPTPPDGGNYTFVTGPNSDIPGGDSCNTVRVCAVLEEGIKKGKTFCTENSSDCYCYTGLRAKDSCLSTFIATLPSPLPSTIPSSSISPTATPTATSSPTSTPTPTATPTPTPTTSVAPSPTASTSPSLTPTPTPLPVGPCSIVSASWPSATAMENQILNIKVTTQGDCIGKSVGFEVRRNVSFWFDEPSIHAVQDATVNTGEATSTWLAEWRNACLVGICDPQFFFKAHIIGETTVVESSSPRLITISKNPGYYINLDGAGINLSGYSDPVSAYKGVNTCLPQWGFCYLDTAIYPVGNLQKYVCKGKVPECDGVNSPSELLPGYPAPEYGGFFSVNTPTLPCDHTLQIDVTDAPPGSATINLVGYMTWYTGACK